MKRILVIEREFGAGASAIAEKAARRLGWKLFDHAMTEEIARLAEVPPELCKRHEERVDPWLRRLARLIWRGNYEQNIPAPDLHELDTDRLVALVRQAVGHAAQAGQCVIVGRAAAHFLRDRPEVFAVYLYAPRSLRFRRVRQRVADASEAAELLDTVDEERNRFMKHYFQVDWPSRHLFHAMLNTAMGDDATVDAILYLMKAAGEREEVRGTVSPSAFLSVSLVGLACLAGCTVGPNYQPPKVAVPPQWTSPLAGGETDQAVAAAGWWKAFGDTNLNALVARAVQSNLDLRIAEARVLEARAQRAVAVGGLRPTLDAGASYSRNRYAVNGFLPLPPGISPDYNLYEAGFDAAWELDVFGGRRRAVEAATADLAAAEFGRRAVLVSLLAEVARNYIEARGFQVRLTIAQQNIQAQQDVVGLTRDRFRTGLSSDLDVQQAATLLAATESQVPVLETGFRHAAYRLGVLLGRPPGALVETLEKQTPIPIPPPEVPVGLPSDLLCRRPDIQRAERELAAATARIGVAAAELFPKFSLTGTAGLESVKASDWWAAGSQFWQVGPTVQWRIFEGGRIRASIHVQTARQEQALAGYEKDVLTAMEDVENALTAYAKERTRRQSLSQAAQASQQALALADQLYRNGLTDFLRVLVSQRALYEAQEAVVLSDQALALDVVTLYKALGGGWEATQGQSDGTSPPGVTRQEKSSPR